MRQVAEDVFFSTQMTQITQMTQMTQMTQKHKALVS